ncbi:hypothetical protein SAMN05428964_101232 [Thalassospira xiamenensis]|jgi:hypothetical protein|uniref:Uncharacterized protein n=1 Tax=Thalassospira xiamenensis TaxID=220697 RepID=A0A285RDE6_9PROT|nr:hypothetical protein SAMN05428964_101232 [Thalassospira xiamenensis]|tara:strand:- start:317 stop:478 length:162 start_codon:yes stop_codon:yes gene_type:complete
MCKADEFFAFKDVLTCLPVFALTGSVKKIDIQPGSEKKLVVRRFHIERAILGK